MKHLFNCLIKKDFNPSTRFKPFEWWYMADFIGRGYSPAKPLRYLMIGYNGRAQCLVSGEYINLNDYIAEDLSSTKNNVKLRKGDINKDDSIPYCEFTRISPKDMGNVIYQIRKNERAKISLEPAPD